MDSLASINAKTRQAYNLAAQTYHDRFHDEMKEKEYDRNLIDVFARKFDKDAIVCDAGCGPSGHIARYVFDKGIQVVGIDISDKCIELARLHNPAIPFERGDISNLAFADRSFDGIISYYSIVDTPRKYVSRIFDEFLRVLKPNGYLLLAVKAGTTEGYSYDLLGIDTEIYFALFTEEEIVSYLEEAGFMPEFTEKRKPYDSEIDNDRIFAIARKSQG